MAIRKASQSDLRAMAEIAAAAFIDDEVFGDLLHPHRRDYPEDYVKYFEQSLLNNWPKLNWRFLVGIDQAASGRVVGFAAWERQGKSYTSANEEFSKSYNAQQQYEEQPNKAADPTKANILEETFPLFSHHWSGARAENWNLDMLAVLPGFQGKGIGKELAMWGVHEAKKDGVCSCVLSGHGKEGFYNKCGFTEVGRANVGKLKELGIKGGAIMFQDAV